MVKMKTYTIKERRDGGSWKPLEHVKLYGTNWQDAKKQFTQWVLGWLGDENSDSAIKAWDELRKNYNSGKFVDTWCDDVYTYTIKAV